MEGREIVAFGAALIAGVLAYSKLIADKESKISDFRKDWINSFREALAEMLGEAYTISGRIRIRVKHAQALKDAAAKKDASAKAAAEVSTDAEEPAMVASSVSTAQPQPVDAALPAEPLALLAREASRASVAGDSATERNGDAEGGAGSDSTPPKEKERLLTEEQIVELEKDLTDHWHSLRKAHRAILLHMNFSETSTGSGDFNVEPIGKDKPAGVWRHLVGAARIPKGLIPAAAYDAKQNGVMSSAAAMLVDQLELLVEKLLGEYDDVGEELRYEEIKKAISHSTLLGNLVLKPEWNRIKGGEPKFNNVLERMKQLSWVGLILLIIFAVFPKKSGDGSAAPKLIIDVNQRPEAPLNCPEMLELRDAWRGTGPISPNLPWCAPLGRRSH